MGIRFSCSACGAKLNVKAELSGKRGACPKCQAKIQIPVESTEAPVVAGSAASTSESAPDLASRSGAAPQVADDPAQRPDRLTSEAKWFVRPPSGGQYGPAAESVLRQWIDEGRITPDTLVWREGDPEWQPASAAFSQLARRPAPAPEKPALSATTSVGFATTPIPTDVGELDAAGAATATLLARRKRARSTGLLVMGVLIVAVLILLPILIYMLTQQGQTPAPGGQAWHRHGDPIVVSAAGQA